MKSSVVSEEDRVYGEHRQQETTASRNLSCDELRMSTTGRPTVNTDARRKDTPPPRNGLTQATVPAAALKHWQHSENTNGFVHADSYFDFEQTVSCDSGDVYETSFGDVFGAELVTAV